MKTVYFLLSFLLAFNCELAQETLGEGRVLDESIKLIYEESVKEET